MQHIQTGFGKQFQGRVVYMFYLVIGNAFNSRIWACELRKRTLHDCRRLHSFTPTAPTTSACFWDWLISNHEMAPALSWQN
jgi:hypothetical protein